MAMVDSSLPPPLGEESLEWAIGAYLFVCCSTGSTDIRLYASHKQFPINLHQFFGESAS